MPKSTALSKPDKSLPEKYKATVTYQRQQRFKNILHQIANRTFTDANLPDTKAKLSNNSRYKSVKELNDQVHAFFKWCGDNTALPTITSLSLFLGWYTDLFWNYIKHDGYSDILKKAKDIMAYRLELATEETGSPGPMFLLKASHGYTEHVAVDVNVTLDIDKLYSKALTRTDKDHKELRDCATKRIGQVEVTDETPNNPELT